MAATSFGHSAGYLVLRQIVHFLEQTENIRWYWVGLIASIVFLIISVSTNRYLPVNYLSFGGEYGAVGLALAQGRGFSDPFSIGSGATAWVSPLLPSMIGLILYLTEFKITAYWILLLIKILSLGCGAGLIWSVLQKSHRGLAPVCCLWMGILCYVYRIELFYQYHDEWIIFLVINLAFWGWDRRGELCGQIVLVVAMSAAALSNPILWGALSVVMLFLDGKAFQTDFEMTEGRLNRQKAFFSRKTMLTAIGVSFLLVAGWTVRNWIQLDMFVPIKSNAGYELFQSQLISKNGVTDASTFMMHPTIPASNEKQAYAYLGEKGFIRIRCDMAIQSILSDPVDYFRRVVHRFGNAFLFTATPYNTAFVDSRIGSDDLERLRRTGFIAHNLYKKNIWIDLDNPDRNLNKALASLGLVNPQLVHADWRDRSDAYYAYRFSGNQVIGGILIGGMPWIAHLIAFLMRQRSGVTPAVWWAGLSMFLYLMPYTLISHYLRYQVPIFGMQAILLAYGTMAVLRKWGKLDKAFD